MKKILALAIAILGVPAMAAPAQAQSMRGLGAFAMDPADDGNAILNVTGRGTIPVSPDVAIFTAGVETTGATAREALAENSRITQQVMAALRSAGIAPRDIQTSRISLDPVMSSERSTYARQRARMMIPPTISEAEADAMEMMIDVETMADEAMQEPDDEEPRIVGYRASNIITVRQRDLDQYGSLVDSLVSAGANTVNGPRFMLDDSDMTVRDARNLAIADARREAEEYAAAAGLRVHRIMMIEQGQTSGLASSPNAEFGFYQAMSSDAMYSAPPPSAPGELQVTVSVGILFELAPL